ncbi:MAG TPA: cytochrome o ubiquinol oxidase subunit III [Candidatus Paceibacterota bacterium]|nr:cytochrome o ubiquinol oxidase subunit III [Candidatus Paceibacterota bacterium]
MNMGANAHEKVSKTRASAPERSLSRGRVTFGFWIYLMSDCVLFAALFATFVVLRGATFGGATPAELVDVPFVFKETIILLTSSFTVGLALLAALQGRKIFTLAALTVTLALGATFLMMELSEFAHLISEGNGPSRSAFLSAFFTLVGTHGAHVFFGAIWMIVLMAHILTKGTTEGNLRKLTCLALFWHFLDVIWIFIFTYVYLLGMVI